MNLKTLQIEEIFRSGVEDYEAFVAMMDDSGTKFLTRKESVVEPPNLYVRETGKTAVAVTQFKDLTPQLRGIQKQLVKYKRADGVDLSFTLIRLLATSRERRCRRLFGHIPSSSRMPRLQARCQARPTASRR